MHPPRSEPVQGWDDVLRHRNADLCPDDHQRHERDLVRWNLHLLRGDLRGLLDLDERDGRMLRHFLPSRLQRAAHSLRRSMRRYHERHPGLRKFVQSVPVWLDVHEQRVRRDVR